MYVVITENDVSQYDDDTGTMYHYPSRYQKLLQPGTVAVYYKGKEGELTNGLALPQKIQVLLELKVTIPFIKITLNNCLEGIIGIWHDNMPLSNRTYV